MERYEDNWTGIENCKNVVLTKVRRQWDHPLGNEQNKIGKLHNTRKNNGEFNIINTNSNNGSNEKKRTVWVRKRNVC